jgi:tetratricopeptide (TPR) repeat protein
MTAGRPGTGRRLYLAAAPIFLTTGCSLERATAPLAAAFLVSMLGLGLWQAWGRRKAGGSSQSSSEMPLFRISSSAMPVVRHVERSDRVRQIEEELEAARTAQEAPRIVAALLELAEALTDGQSRERAAAIYEECVPLLHSAGSATEEGQVLLKLSYTYFSARRFDRACEAYERTYNHGLEHRDPRLQGRALDGLAESYVLQFRWEHAVKAMQRRLAVAETVGERPAVFAALLRLGEWSLQAGDEAGGLSYLQRSLEEARTRENTRDESRALCRLGKALFVLGQPHRTVALLSTNVERALSWSETFDSSRVLSVLGDAFLELGDPEHAIPIYERHRALLRHANEDKAYLLGNLAAAYVKRGDREAALACLQEAEEIIAKTQNVARPETLDALGRAHLEIGEARKALSYAQQALERARKKDDAPSEILALYGIARAHVQLDEPRLALERLPRALELLRRHPSPRMESLVHEQLALASAKVGDVATTTVSLQVRLTYLRAIGHRTAPEPAPPPPPPPPPSKVPA